MMLMVNPYLNGQKNIVRGLNLSNTKIMFMFVKIMFFHCLLMIRERLQCQSVIKEFDQNNIIILY